MLPALALLWTAARRPWAAAGWGASAVLISHRWLLGLHPLTWIGVPAPLSLPVAMGGWLGCAAAAAVLVAVWALLARWCRRPRWTTALLMAGLWGLGEVTLAQGPLFWIGVGGSVLPADPLLAGLARWIGAGGLAFLQVLAGWWLWQLMVQPASRKRVWWGLGAVLVAHGLGWWALANGQTQVSQSTPPSAPPAQVRVGLWQPALPTREKFTAAQQRLLPLQLQQAMEKASQADAAALVAPEGTFPRQGELLEPAPLPLLTGGFRWKRGQQRSALLLVEPGALRPSAALDKHRLVPLGEWIPAWFGSVSGLSAVGGLEPGAPSRLWRWQGPPAAVAICYELSDGAALARAVAEGAEWLLTVANLDPYPLLLQHQFLALARLRAIETARPLLSAANTGPSGAVSSKGDVQSQLPPMEPGLVIAMVEPQQGLTPYVRWGERPLWLLMVVIVIVRVRSQVAESSRPPAPALRRRTPPPDQG